MSQKTELQSNNTDLQTILSKVNGLPSGSALGDATAADVAQGKTFSSAFGIKVAGTLVPMEVLTGTATGTGSTTLPDGNTGSKLSGLPTGKNNIFVTAMSNGSSSDFLYHLLIVNGVVFSYSNYRNNYYVYNDGNANFKLYPESGILSAKETYHLAKGVQFKYFVW